MGKAGRYNAKVEQLLAMDGVAMDREYYRAKNGQFASKGAGSASSGSSELEKAASKPKTRGFGKTALKSYGGLLAGSLLGGGLGSVLGPAGSIAGANLGAHLGAFMGHRSGLKSEKKEGHKVKHPLGRALGALAAGGPGALVSEGLRYFGHTPDVEETVSKKKKPKPDVEAEKKTSRPRKKKSPLESAANKPKTQGLQGFMKTGSGQRKLDKDDLRLGMKYGKKIDEADKMSGSREERMARFNSINSERDNDPEFQKWNERKAKRDLARQRLKNSKIDWGRYKANSMLSSSHTDPDTKAGLEMANKIDQIERQNIPQGEKNRLIKGLHNSARKKTTF